MLILLNVISLKSTKFKFQFSNFIRYLKSFLYIPGCQCSWIKWKSPFQGYVNSRPMTLSIHNYNRLALQCTFKVVHYTVKYFLKSAENYLTMIDSMMVKKYVSQKGEKIVQFWIKYHIFQKFYSVNVNKSLREALTAELWPYLT